jgi:hypothetical protein
MSAVEASNKNKLVHSSFRIKENVLNALEKEAGKRGISLSSLINKTLEDYVTCDMYFERLGFLLVSKDFLRNVFSQLKGKKEIDEIGRRLGQTIAKEYVSYFYPEVNSTTLIEFLGLWFRRFQSYHHRVDNRLHCFTVSHDINMNFSLELKAMLCGLIEPVALGVVKFTSVTDGAVTFSFEI